ncbi:MAG: hypothetical protein ACRDJ1_10195 [Actinomycetota bacterium]
MGSKQNPKALRTPRPRAVSYRGEPFAPATATYPTISSRSLNLTTVADSGYGPSAVDRLAELGSLGPLALAAVWEAAFAFEAGPLSTWVN